MLSWSFKPCLLLSNSFALIVNHVCDTLAAILTSIMLASFASPPTDPPLDDIHFLIILFKGQHSSTQHSIVRFTSYADLHLTNLTLALFVLQFDTCFIDEALHVLEWKEIMDLEYHALVS